MNDEDTEVIDAAATAAWAQIVARMPEVTFTPRDRKMVLVGFGLGVVAMLAARGGSSV